MRPLSTPRDHWMDVLRGTSILLVILVHSFQITEASTGHEFSRLAQFNNIVSPLRMPTMFFLSGLLVPRSLAKGMGTYIAGKLRRIAHPYFLWSVLLFAMFALASVTIGWNFQPDLIWNMFYSPIDHLWFLAYLFLYFMLAMVTVRLPAFVLVAASFALVALPIGGNWDKFWGFAAFFMLGVFAGEVRPQFDKARTSLLLSWALLLMAVTLTTISTLGTAQIPSGPWNAPVVLMFIVGAAGVLTPIAGTKAFAPLRYVGVNSMVFFLLHWPAIIFGVRIMGEYTSMGPSEILIAGTLLGCAVPLLFAVLAHRFRVVDFLFAWPVRGTAPSKGDSIP